ncbi:MAG: hypothetical protein IT442_12345 [Phycisphaeraceae bacterium]|nr:hypothetical protein [Phycisphaeraceae bacterium]
MIVVVFPSRLNFLPEKHCIMIEPVAHTLAEVVNVVNPQAEGESADAWGKNSWDHFDITPGLRMYQSNTGVWNFFDEAGYPIVELEPDVLKRLVKALRAGGSGIPQHVRDQRHREAEVRQREADRKAAEALANTPEMRAQREFDAKIAASLERLKAPGNGGISRDL